MKAKSKLVGIKRVRTNLGGDERFRLDLHPPHEIGVRRTNELRRVAHEFVFLVGHDEEMQSRCRPNVAKGE